MYTLHNSLADGDVPLFHNSIDLYRLSKIIFMNMQIKRDVILVTPMASPVFKSMAFYCQVISFIA